MEDFLKKAQPYTSSGATLVELYKLATIAQRALDFNPSPVDLLHDAQKLDPNIVKQIKVDLEDLFIRNGVEIPKL